MERLEIKKLYSSAADYADQTVTVCGWVKTIRSSKSLGFIELNDGSNFGNLQVVFEDNKLNNFKEITKLNVGSALVVTGVVVLTPDAKQPFEIHAEEISIEGTSTSDYPLQKKRHSLEFLRTIAHLRPRTNTFNAVFRVRSVAAFAIHRFLWKNDKFDRFWTTRSRMHGDGFWKGVYVWTNFPCRKQLYCPSCSGILDGRTGNRICRSSRLHGSCTGYAAICHQICTGYLPTGNEILQ